MDPKKFKEQAHKVGKTNVVEVVKQDFLAPDYNIVIYSNNPASDSGLVKVLEIIPRDANLESFLMRWDKNSQIADVDIYKNGKKQNLLFWEQNSFKGHHPQEIENKDKGRILRVDISSLRGIIFQGLVKVAIHREAHFKEGVSLG
jgi:hypothetical protein